MANNDSWRKLQTNCCRSCKKSLQIKIYNRIMVTHLLMDEEKENRIGGAVGFNMRTGDFSCI